MDEKNAKKSVEDLKSSIENKVKEEVETLLEGGLEEIAGGFNDSEIIADDDKRCACGLAFARA